MLEPYGGRAPSTGATSPRTAFSRTNSPSSAPLRSPCPSVFFGIAAFLLNVVLGRLVEAQREQIASLKALGFPYPADRASLLQARNARLPDRVGRRRARGHRSGQGMIENYRAFFRFPD